MGDNYNKDILLYKDLNTGYTTWKFFQESNPLKPFTT